MLESRRKIFAHGQTWHLVQGGVSADFAIRFLTFQVGVAVVGHPEMKGVEAVVC